jgi:hypothetical protein
VVEPDNPLSRGRASYRAKPGRPACSWSSKTPDRSNSGIRCSASLCTSRRKTLGWTRRLIEPASSIWRLCPDRAPRPGRAGGGSEGRTGHRAPARDYSRCPGFRPRSARRALDLPGPSRVEPRARAAGPDPARPVPPPSPPPDRPRRTVRDRTSDGTMPDSGSFLARHRQAKHRCRLRRKNQEPGLSPMAPPAAQG